MKTKTYTDEELDELSYSDEYAEYIMAHANELTSTSICNGDMLLKAMESGYLFDEFLATK